MVDKGAVCDHTSEGDVIVPGFICPYPLSALLFFSLAAPSLIVLITSGGTGPWFRGPLSFSGAPLGMNRTHTQAAICRTSHNGPLYTCSEFLVIRVRACLYPAEGQFSHGGDRLRGSKGPPVMEGPLKRMEMKDFVCCIVSKQIINAMEFVSK